MPSPSPTLNRFSHTLNVIRGRAYIFGGDGDGVSSGDNAMHVVTLPTDLELGDTDYQELNGGNESETKPAPRAGHTAAVVGERIYLFGGSPPTGSSDPTAAPNPPLDEDGRVYVFDTVRKMWEALYPNKEACTNGVPTPRNYARSASTVHPLPLAKKEVGGKEHGELMTAEARLRSASSRGGEAYTATEEQQPEGYGTILLHGGHDLEGNSLRDIWAFDVASRTWSRWPDLPDSGPEDGEGNICCIDSRLWRCGDGLGKVAHLDIVRQQFDDISSKGEYGIGPKTGRWVVHSFGGKEGHGEVEEAVEKKMGKPGDAESLFPPPRKRSGFVPVTTGQGREYLLLFMGETGPNGVLGDVWSYQIGSEKKSAAAFKDAVKGLIGKPTGLEQWAKADLLGTKRGDDVLECPRGLSRFGSSPGGDWDDAIVIWGGITAGGEVSADGWKLTVE